MYYCHCEKHDSSAHDLKCDFAREVQNPANVKAKNKVKAPLVGEKASRRRREVSKDDAMYSDDVIEYEPMEHEFKANPPLTLKWPSHGITEAKARQHCRGTIRNSTLYHLCAKVPRFDVYKEVSGCMENIQVFHVVTVILVVN